MNVAVFEDVSMFPVMQGSESCIVMLGSQSAEDSWTALIKPTGVQIRSARKSGAPCVTSEKAPPSVVEPDLVACYYAGLLVQYAETTGLYRRTLVGMAPPKCSKSPRCIVMRCVAFCEGAGHPLLAHPNCLLVHASETSIAYVIKDHFLEFVFLADAARVVHRRGSRSQTVSFLYPATLECSGSGKWKSSSKDSTTDWLIRSVEASMRNELMGFPVFANTQVRRTYTVQCPPQSHSKVDPDQ